MTLISLHNGDNLNSDHVVKFNILHDGRYQFGMSDGSVHFGHTPEPEEAFFPIVPAAAGFKAVDTDIGDGGRFWVIRPIIAWRLCPGGNYPLVAGRLDDDVYAAIVDPDGKVIDMDGNSYESLDQFKAIIADEDASHLSKVA